MVSIVDASVAGNLRSTCSYLLDHIDTHLDAIGPKVIDLAEHEVAGRNEGYVPSWADDLLALVAGLGVRFPWPPRRSTFLMTAIYASGPCWSVARRNWLIITPSATWALRQMPWTSSMGVIESFNHEQQKRIRTNGHAL